MNKQDPRKPNDAIEKQNNNHNHPGPQKVVNIHKKVAKEPTMVKINKNLCVLPSLSDISPKIGPTIAIDKAEKATATAHIDEPVKLNPKNSIESPKEALNKLTKYTGTMATAAEVAKAEFAQSYIAHA
tara:strand:- start:344 stop:727 length:384 start_codon:yes stop_codon:yes gene_type:complete